MGAISKFECGDVFVIMQPLPTVTHFYKCTVEGSECILENTVGYEFKLPTEEIKAGTDNGKLYIVWSFCNIKEKA